MLNKLKELKRELLQTKKIKIILIVLCGLLVQCLELSAQNPARSRIKEFTNRQDSIEIFNLMMNYMANKDSASTIDTILRYTTGVLTKKTIENDRVLIKPPAGFSFGFNYLNSIDVADSIALAKIVAPVDYTKLFGWFELDWYFFLTKNEKKEWRIYDIRTQSENQKMYSMVKVMDVDTGLPPMVKPLIVREQCGTLLSNSQIKEIFDKNKQSFIDLAEKVNSLDSLINILRIDNKVSILNRTLIDWSDAAEDMPQDAIDWMMARLDKSGKKKLQAELKRNEKIRSQGMDTLKSVAAMYTLKLDDIKQIIVNMQNLRVVGLAKLIKSKGVIQFVTGGRDQDIAGILYSPKGFLPQITPEEYFCLEELAENWWIFRRT